MKNYNHWQIAFGEKMRVLVICDRRSTKLKPITDSFKKSQLVHREQEGASGYLYLFIRSIIKSIKMKPSVIIGSNAFPAIIALLIGLLSNTTIIWRVGGDWKTHTIKLKDAIKKSNITLVAKYLSLVLSNKVLFHFVDGMLVVNEKLKRKAMNESGLSKRKIHKVEVPIKNNQMNSLLSIPIYPENNKNIITVTNFDHYVKYSALIDTLPQIKMVLENNEDHHYFIIGGGRYLPDIVEEIEKEVNNPEIQQRIHICGYIKNIGKIYEYGDIMLYVSYSDGYPNVIIEAQAAGVPVIANRVGGIPEQIDDKNTGILFSSPQNNRIHELISEISENKKLYTNIAHNSRSVVKRRNSYEKIAEEYEEAINSIYC